MATTAIVAATTLAYYWGYQDVEKRHIERERGYLASSPGLKSRHGKFAEHDVQEQLPARTREKNGVEEEGWAIS